MPASTFPLYFRLHKIIGNRLVRIQWQILLIGKAPRCLATHFLWSGI